MYPPRDGFAAPELGRSTRVPQQFIVDETCDGFPASGCGCTKSSVLLGRRHLGRVVGCWPARRTLPVDG